MLLCCSKIEQIKGDRGTNVAECCRAGTKCEPKSKCMSRSDVQAFTKTDIFCRVVAHHSSTHTFTLRFCFRVTHRFPSLRCQRSIIINICIGTSIDLNWCTCFCAPHKKSKATVDSVRVCASTSFLVRGIGWMLFLIPGLEKERAQETKLTNELSKVR